MAEDIKDISKKLLEPECEEVLEEAEKIIICKMLEALEQLKEIV